MEENKEETLLKLDDIIYLKKACRAGYDSHSPDIPRLNRIIDTLYEKAEKWDELNKLGDYEEKVETYRHYLEQEIK